MNDVPPGGQRVNAPNVVTADETAAAEADASRVKEEMKKASNLGKLPSDADRKDEDKRKEARGAAKEIDAGA